jgi:hypothetical protein
MQPVLQEVELTERKTSVVAASNFRPDISGNAVTYLPPNRATLIGLRGFLLSLGRFKQVA